MPLSINDAPIKSGARNLCRTLDDFDGSLQRTTANHLFNSHKGCDYFLICQTLVLFERKSKLYPDTFTSDDRVSKLLSDLYLSYVYAWDSRVMIAERQKDLEPGSQPLLDALELYNPLLPFHDGHRAPGSLRTLNVDIFWRLYVRLLANRTQMYKTRSKTLIHDTHQSLVPISEITARTTAKSPVWGTAVYPATTHSLQRILFTEKKVGKSCKTIAGLELWATGWMH